MTQSDFDPKNPKIYHYYEVKTHSKSTGKWVSTTMYIPADAMESILAKEKSVGRDYVYENHIDTYTIIDQRKCPVMKLVGVKTETGDIPSLK